MNREITHEQFHCQNNELRNYSCKENSYFKLLWTGQNLVVEKKCPPGSGDKTTDHFATSSAEGMSVVKYGVTTQRRRVT